MHAGGSDFASSVEATQCCTTVKAGAETAASIVRGGCDRDAFSRRIKPNLATCGGNRRESLVEAFSQMGCIEVNMISDTGRRLGHAPADRCSNNVARRKIFLRMHPFHDSFTCGVIEDRPLAPHCLRHQRLLPGGTRSTPHHCWVKLDELDIGHRQACSERHRYSIARHRWRVRR